MPRFSWMTPLMFGRLRQIEQFGTDSKSGSLGGFGVDFNTDARVFHPELHDAAIGSEVVRVANREHAAVSECFEDAANALALRSGNKENLARSRLLGIRKQANRNGPVRHRFSAYRVVESRAERIVAQH